MSIEIEGPALEKACREMIESMLFCLPNAYKGTIYRIGRPPNLTAKRITSGVIDRQRNTISWGLPEKSDYNPPGRPFVEYRDEDNRPLEAMGWCVERQQCWTAEDPINDRRSVRLQVEGLDSDFHHMEPVLVHKSDLHFDVYSSSVFPRDHKGNILWKDSDYVVVAVIKIHFYPNTIHIGSPETRVIKRLSRSLGTELLSYQLRQDSMTAMQQLAKDRLNACNILADSLRNAIAKSGLIFSLIKTEIGDLRDRWETVLLQERNEKNAKREAIDELNESLLAVGKDYRYLSEDLMNVQNRFLELRLPPDKGEHWVAIQIEERWKGLLNVCPLDEEKTERVWEVIDKLKESLRFGEAPDIIEQYDKIPKNLTREWVELIYKGYDRYNAATLERLIEILSRRSLNIPYQARSRKTLIQLKALADTMSQLERNTNFLLRQVLNGGKNEEINEILNSIATKQDRKKPLKTQEKAAC